MYAQIFLLNTSVRKTVPLKEVFDKDSNSAIIDFEISNYKKENTYYYRVCKNNILQECNQPHKHLKKIQILCIAATDVLAEAEL